MPVLRSREIVPIVKSKTPGKTSQGGAIEPETLAKAGGGLNDHLNTQSPITPNQSVGSGSGVVKRRSARLASKLGLTEVIEDDRKSSRKGKKLGSGDNGISINAFNLGTPESDNQGDVENEAFHLREKLVGVADGIGLETGVLEDENLVTAGAVVVGTRLGGNELAHSSDMGTPGSTDDKVETARKGQRKRKSGTEILLQLEDAGQGEGEKRLLNLRSGKRIAKVEGECGDRYNEAEHNFHVDSDCVKQNGSILEGCGADGGTRNWSEADAKGAENGSFNSGIKSSRQEKGKMKVPEEDSIIRGLVELELDVKEVDGGNAAVGSTRRIDKGKEKLVDDDVPCESISILEPKSAAGIEVENGNIASNSSDGIPSQELDHARGLSSIYPERRRGYQERFRDIAKRNASRFAHFSSQAEQEEDNNFVDAPGRHSPQPETNGETEDWPGPFSTAMKIIRDREMNARVQQHNSSGKGKTASVLWTPKKDKKCNSQKKLVPSLQDLCLSILVKNADAITSLDCVPDLLRHTLSHLLCNTRRMDSHFFHLLVHGSPTEIHLSDCSWLTEDDFTKAFEKCDVGNLTVVQLDQGGRCLADYILTTTLARSPKSLPALVSISLRGSYRFSDAGISVLVSSAPALRSINLSQCPLLTSDGIFCLAASLGSVLKELYLDDCQGIDAMDILPALLKIDNLEVLSLAGIETVSDHFISEFSRVRGHNVKELVLANCTKLTDSSVRVVAEMSPKICAIDLSNLCKLTDAAIGYLANGCRAIQNLKLCRNTFSDEAVAAYLEICGEPLKELTLSNVIMVAENTAISLARHSRNLNRLDLSWCRSLTEEALGLIVDSCSSLKVLKVFGCTQITNVFLSGHSNSEVEIIGLKMKPILKHLNSPDFLQGPFRYSFSSAPFLCSRLVCLELFLAGERVVSGSV